MTFLRNLLTLCGMIAIVAASVFAFRPDLYNNIIAKNLPAPPNQLTGHAYGLLSAQRGTLIEDASAPADGVKFVYSELIDGEAVDSVPSNNATFLLVINKGKNEIRYWKLNKNVRSVSLRDSKSTSFDVKFKQINSSGAPFQAVVWIPRESDLNLKFELGAQTPRS